MAKERLCRDAQCTWLRNNVGLLIGVNWSAALSRKPKST